MTLFDSGENDGLFIMCAPSCSRHEKPTYHETSWNITHCEILLAILCDMFVLGHIAPVACIAARLGSIQVFERWHFMFDIVWCFVNIDIHNHIFIRIYFVYILSSLVVTTRKSTEKSTGQNAKYCGCLSRVPPKARKKKLEQKYEKKNEKMHEKKHDKRHKKNTTKSTKKNTEKTPKNHEKKHGKKQDHHQEGETYIEKKRDKHEKKHGKKHQNTVKKAPGKAQKVPPAKSPKDTRKSTTKNTGKPHQKKRAGTHKNAPEILQIKTQENHENRGAPPGW